MQLAEDQSPQGNTPTWKPGQRLTYIDHLSESFGKQVVEQLEATYLGTAPGGRLLIEVLLPGKRNRRGATAARRVQMRVQRSEVCER